MHMRKVDKVLDDDITVGVLIISPTVGGCGLGGLRSNVDSEGGKYTSAIASVYLPPSSSTLR